MAQAAAEGAGSIPRTEVTVKRVPEVMPPEMARTAGVKLDQAAPIATPAELADYDAILIGTPTRYGRMASQMANVLDQTGSLWASNALVGKVGSAFVSTATQHGGQEATLLSIVTNLLHFGMVVVGLPYTASSQMRIDEITGGSPYGAPQRSPASVASAGPAKPSWSSCAFRDGTSLKLRASSRSDPT